MTIPARFLTGDAVKAQVQRLLVDCPELREDDEALVISLESETDAIELCTKLVKKIGETEAHSAGVTGYINDLRSRIQTLDLRAERLRVLLLQIMEAAGVKSLPLPIATLSVRYPEKVQVIEPDIIPEYYRRQPPWEPNKLLIKAALKSGASVPGCALSNSEPSLTIRVK